MAEDKKEDDKSNDKSSNKKPRVKETTGDKLMPVSQFIALVGLEPRLKLWATKMYGKSEPKTGNQWFVEFNKQGVMDTAPSILNQ